SSFEFAQAIQKIHQTPVDNKTACAIHRAIKQLNKAREQISKDYQEKIVDRFAKKNEKGEVIRPSDNPSGFDVIEGQEEEFSKAQEDFGKTPFTMQTGPFTPQTFKDIKMSGRDLEVLKEFFLDS